MRRFEEVAAYYGSRFSCQLPGISTYANVTRPVCDTYQAQDVNDTVGILDLITADFRAPAGAVTELTGKAIGIYHDSSGCRPRCSSFAYSAEELPVSNKDADMVTREFKLFFESLSAEVWREYRLLDGFGFASQIGGLLGLILGASLLSLNLMLLEVAEALGEAWQPVQSRKSRKASSQD